MSTDALSGTPNLPVYPNRGCFLKLPLQFVYFLRLPFNTIQVRNSGCGPCSVSRVLYIATHALQKKKKPAHGLPTLAPWKTAAYLEQAKQPKPVGSGSTKRFSNGLPCQLETWTKTCGPIPGA